MAILIQLLSINSLIGIMNYIHGQCIVSLLRLRQLDQGGSSLPGDDCAIPNRLSRYSALSNAHILELFKKFNVRDNRGTELNKAVLKSKPI